MNLNLSRKLWLYSAMLLLLVFISGCTFLGRETAQVQQQDHLASAEKDTAPQYTISWTMHQNIPVPENAEMIAYIEDRFDVEVRNCWRMIRPIRKGKCHTWGVAGLIKSLFLQYSGQFGSVSVMRPVQPREREL